MWLETASDVINLDHIESITVSSSSGRYEVRGYVANAQNRYTPFCSFVTLGEAEAYFKRLKSRFRTNAMLLAKETL